MYCAGYSTRTGLNSCSRDNLALHVKCLLTSILMYFESHTNIKTYLEGTIGNNLIFKSFFKKLAVPTVGNMLSLVINHTPLPNYIMLIL